MAGISRAMAVATILAVATMVEPSGALAAAAAAVPSTPTPPSPLPSPSPTWRCTAEWTWLSRELPPEAVAGVPFTVHYAYRGGTAMIRRTEETVPAGWQVLSEPVSEHVGDTYVWNGALQEIEVLPPADRPSGDYRFHGSTISYHACNGDVSMYIEGDDTVHLQAASTPCIGDCGANRQVTIDNVLTLVNIVLGDAQPTACPQGVLSGATVDVALIIQAVNNALNGCPQTVTPTATPTPTPTPTGLPTRTPTCACWSPTSTPRATPTTTLACRSAECGLEVPP